MGLKSTCCSSVVVVFLGAVIFAYPGVMSLILSSIQSKNTLAPPLYDVSSLRAIPYRATFADAARYTHAPSHFQTRSPRTAMPNRSPTDAPVTVAPTTQPSASNSLTSSPFTETPTTLAPATASPATSHPTTVSPTASPSTTPPVVRVDFDSVTEPVDIILNHSATTVVLYSARNDTAHTLVELQSEWAYGNCVYMQSSGNLTEPRANAYDIALTAPADGTAYRYIMDTLHGECTSGAGQCAACRRLRVAWPTHVTSVTQMHPVCSRSDVPETVVFNASLNADGVWRAYWFPSLCVNMTMWRVNGTHIDRSAACGVGQGSLLHSEAHMVTHDTAARSTDSADVPHTLCYECANGSTCALDAILVNKL
ncbi:hypothetical protein CYMTET_40118 [Cymbomonas tetramitiformis]|uniref:Uncharacterized protein n=1 Tax=Cymbomonas tetramitiformis TaxID=36881 RepID=A0AAE0C9X1_9CHLO|nr:hypothetical protein CYMTET_40118 [Cymbomonas tetramitiformis]